eukprot:scaffold7356_cov249-Pinguiococcus_pyrenoidosus.AAC.11
MGAPLPNRRLLLTSRPSLASPGFKVPVMILVSSGRLTKASLGAMAHMLASFAAACSLKAKDTPSGQKSSSSSKTPAETSRPLGFFAPVTYATRTLTAAYRSKTRMAARHAFPRAPFASQYPSGALLGSEHFCLTLSTTSSISARATRCACDTLGAKRGDFPFWAPSPSLGTPLFFLGQTKMSTIRGGVAGLPQELRVQACLQCILQLGQHSRCDFTVRLVGRELLHNLTQRVPRLSKDLLLILDGADRHLPRGKSAPAFCPLQRSHREQGFDTCQGQLRLLFRAERRSLRLDGLQVGLKHCPSAHADRLLPDALKLGKAAELHDIRPHQPPQPLKRQDRRILVHRIHLVQCVAIERLREQREHKSTKAGSPLVLREVPAVVDERVEERLHRAVADLRPRVTADALELVQHDEPQPDVLRIGGGGVVHLLARHDIRNAPDHPHGRERDVHVLLLRSVDAGALDQLHQHGHFDLLEIVIHNELHAVEAIDQRIGAPARQGTPGLAVVFRVGLRALRQKASLRARLPGGRFLLNLLSNRHALQKRKDGLPVLPKQVAAGPQHAVQPREHPHASIRERRPSAVLQAHQHLLNEDSIRNRVLLDLRAPRRCRRLGQGEKRQEDDVLVDEGRSGSDRRIRVRVTTELREEGVPPEGQVHKLTELRVRIPVLRRVARVCPATIARRFLAGGLDPKHGNIMQRLDAKSPRLWIPRLDHQAEMLGDRLPDEWEAKAVRQREP